MEILITGKSSYIGNQVGTYLKNQSHHVIYQSLKESKTETLSFKGIDVLFHVAGIAHVSYNKKDDHIYDEVNHILTKEVALKAKKEGVKQFIFMSSMIVYSPNQKAIDEKTSVAPKGPYAKSKYHAEKAIKTLESKTFKVVILRPAMIYGKNSLGNFPKLVKMINQIPFFPNYPNLRSFLYIEHLNIAVQDIIEKELRGLFHLSDEPISTKTLVETISQVSQKKLIFTRIFNPIISLFQFIKTLNKLFGTYYYDETLYKQSFKYHVYSLEERIRKSL